MKKHIHYEKAFEDYLLCGRVPFVAVDEAKRAAFRGAKLKSFDFIVYSHGQVNWLVDIKGRRWTARKTTQKPSWENWVTQADLDGLSQWQEVFGVGFRSMFVFAYQIKTDALPPAELIHTYHNEKYVFAGVPLDIYQQHARVRSPKWGTVNMPTRDFAEHVQPMRDWL